LKNKKHKNQQADNQIHYAGFTELMEFDSELVNYNKHLVEMLVTKSAFVPGSLVLDFGAGIGSLAKLWAQSTGHKPHCLEIDPTGIKELQKLEFTVFQEITQVLAKYNVIYSSNVLEHIEDDTAALIDLRHLLCKDGKIIIYVPALQFLFSDLDRKVGHFRRYNKGELMKKLEMSGYEVLSLQYVDFIGVLASLAVKFFGWRNKFKIGSKQSVRFYDRFVFPISVFLDQIGMHRILGKNLLLVARKRT